MSSSSAANSGKINSVYAALDAHQYTRAIKLASALPPTNILGQSLLALAYCRAGQKYNALKTLSTVLQNGTGDGSSSSSGSSNEGGSMQYCYFELQYEIETCLEATIEREKTQATAPSTTADSSNNPTSSAPSSSSSSAAATTTKKGKKGKKKPAASKQKHQQQQQQNQQQQQQQKDVQSSTTALWVPVGDDLVDRLTTQPTLPAVENFDAAFLTPKHMAITDETILATLVMSLQAYKLSFTAFQMYASAAASVPNEMTLLQKTFTSGLGVLSVPTKWKPRETLETYVLSHMQATALQIARLAAASSSSSGGDNFPLMLATSWAAQSSLWQLEWLPHDDKRSMILPRLAESMSQRLIKQEQETYEHQQQLAATDTSDGGSSSTPARTTSQPPFRNSAEIQLLNFRTYKAQSKWEDLLQSIEQDPCVDSGTSVAVTDEGSNNNSDGSKEDGEDATNEDEYATRSAVTTSSQFGVTLPVRQVLMEQTSMLKKLCRWKDAQLVYEKMIYESPDDWSCWKGHLECTILQERMEDTEQLVGTILELQNDRPFQLRGPHLMKVELSFERVKQNTSRPAFEQLVSSVIGYGNIFARKASCAFADLEIYLDHLIAADEEDVRDAVCNLLEYASSLRQENHDTSLGTDGGSSTENDSSTIDNKERRYRLRAYIFASKLTHKLLSVPTYQDLLPKYLPDWKELVSEWKSTTTIPISEEVDESLRDVMPNDDLILLATQQLLGSSSINPNPDFDLVSAVLLEMAIRHSPDNAYLKIAAIEVYHRLNASARIWELYQGVGLKHIQLDSCSYIVLPYLLEGGLYNEAIEVASALLRFHKSSSRDCEFYAGKAMENGTLSKADEFLSFQRRKLNPSLIFHFSKGLILDSAPLFATPVPRKKIDDDPLFKGGLGINQGIVGRDDDKERAVQMVVENNNPYAALSVISWASMGGLTDGDDFSDNRDQSLLKYFKILTKPSVVKKDTMLKETLRRGYFHGILVRATFCVDAMKGPKKGKLVKPSEQLKTRTNSLLGTVLAASETLADFQGADKVHLSLSETIFSLCRFLAIVNSGLPMVNEEDSLASREERASEIMKQHCLLHLTAARELLSDSTDLNVLYYLLPSFIVPMFSLFRMSANVCDAYGWGKRKAKTKKCAAAMAEFALELNRMIQSLMKSVASLPSCSPSEVLESNNLTEDDSSILDPSMLASTVKQVQESRFRKRMRIEPVLQEMDEYLDEFKIEE